MSDKRRTIERFNQGTNRKRGDTSKCCISPSEGVLHGRFVELLGQHLLVSDEIQLGRALNRFWLYLGFQSSRPKGTLAGPSRSSINL
ncbi:hypothetical protein AcV7_006088 [Taiwanofungus camphoratus]|nr:hypothetical protein AcV7_006088 [Antrodia cinnamomea]